MSESQDTRRRVRLILHNHIITGELRMGDVRFSDQLNDVHRSFIELDNAAFSRFSEPEKIINETPRTVIPKDKVIVAYELAADAEASRKDIRYRERRKYSVFIATKDTEIHGILHATPTEVRPDLSLIQNRWFIPLTRATVIFCCDENSELTQEAILVNVREIQYFAVGDAVDTEKEPQDNAA